jgi:hypothetical protein
MPDIVTQMNTSVASDLKARWNGRFPTWEEFQGASKSGRVQVNKNIGIKAIWLTGVPKSFMILYGIVTA